MRAGLSPIEAHRAAAERRWGEATPSRKLAQTAKQGLHPELMLLKEIGINSDIQIHLLEDILVELRSEGDDYSQT